MTPLAMPPKKIVYPVTDGEPIAEHTLQFGWIITIKENLDALFRDQPDVFVAGDLFWYPVEGDNKIRTAPDVMVVFGRPKGERGSYRQWEEGGIAPQIVFEILSPGNRPAEMSRKALFYDRFGVDEYYIYDPLNHVLDGLIRRDGALTPIDSMHDWVSPLLGIRFEISDEDLMIRRPDGRPFLSFDELWQEREAAQTQIDEVTKRSEEDRLARLQAQARADAAQQKAELAQQDAEFARQKAEALAAKLRAMGVDPDAP